MDFWATKDRHEREEDEAERLVREAPKKKPPRRDRRRENMETERDPDVQGERDPDLSKNYKDIGGSVAARWAKTKKIPAENRDGDIVFITPDTLKEKPGEYKELDTEEAAKAQKDKKKQKKDKKKPPGKAAPEGPEGAGAKAAPEKAQDRQVGFYQKMEEINQRRSK